MKTIEQRLASEGPTDPVDHIALHKPCVLGAQKRLERGGSYTTNQLQELVTIARHSIELIDALPEPTKTKFTELREEFGKSLAVIKDRLKSAQPTLAA